MKSAVRGGQVFAQAEMVQRRNPQQGGAYSGYLNYDINNGDPFTSNFASDGNRIYIDITAVTRPRDR